MAKYIFPLISPYLSSPELEFVSFSSNMATSFCSRTNFICISLLFHVNHNFFLFRKAGLLREWTNAHTKDKIEKYATYASILRLREVAKR